MRSAGESHGALLLSFLVSPVPRARAQFHREILPPRTLEHETSRAGATLFLSRSRLYALREERRSTEKRTCIRVRKTETWDGYSGGVGDERRGFNFGFCSLSKRYKNLNGRWGALVVALLLPHARVERRGGETSCCLKEGAKILLLRWVCSCEVVCVNLMHLKGS